MSQEQGKIDFTDHSRAVRRFQDDTEVFKAYFCSLDEKPAGFERFTDEQFTKLKIFFDLLVAYGFVNVDVDYSGREIESFMPKLGDLFGDACLRKIASVQNRLITKSNYKLFN